MIMTDHPSWVTGADGNPHRAIDNHGVSALITTLRAGSGDVVFDLGGGGAEVAWIDPGALSGPDDLVEPLNQQGIVARVANPSLWNAMSAAIMRQVVQAGTARTRYIRFCTAHGEMVSRDDRTTFLFPAPERLLALSDHDFDTVGAAFPRDALRHAARSYLTDGARWEELWPLDLVTALQTVPRVGPWTAKCAVADYTNDFSIYDYSDIAVQPGAQALNPARVWPQGAPAFKAAWEEIAGNQLSEWTILTLTWGMNHGKIDRSATS